MHAHASRPIQFSLWDDSVCVTTDCSGSFSETLSTLGREIPLDADASDVTPPDTPESSPEETPDDGAKEDVVFPVCFIALEDEDGLEELGGGELTGGLEDRTALDEAGDCELEVRSGKYGSD